MSLVESSCTAEDTSHLRDPWAGPTSKGMEATLKHVFSNVDSFNQAELPLLQSAANPASRATQPDLDTDSSLLEVPD